MSGANPLRGTRGMREIEKRKVRMKYNEKVQSKKWKDGLKKNVTGEKNGGLWGLKQQGNE